MRSMRGIRCGFTLTELLVVLVIIAILVALLLPAISGAVIRAREAAVSAELNSLSTALISYKSLHDCYPPSRVVLSETGDYSPAYFKANLSPQQAAYAIALTPRSLTYIRKIWPRVPFSASTPPMGILYDFNGDGKASPPVILQGHECLTFFLGGIPSQDVTGKWSLTGFCLNPTNPFQSSSVAFNRSKPDYDFDNGRLADMDSNGFPEYVDSFGGPGDPSPICYFSGYEGQGYDCDDININEPDNTETYNPILGAFIASNDPTSTNPTNTKGFTASPPPNAYTSGPPTSLQSTWIKPQSFQLVTSGRDRKFGASGVYDSSSSNRLPFYSPTLVTGQNIDSGSRIVENDNLSNFTTGRLSP